MPAEHLGEHRVTAFGLDDQDGGRKRHHDAAERRQPDVVVELLARVRRDPLRHQRPVVDVEQLGGVGATVGCGEAATDEVRDVHRRRPPGGGLPVDDHRYRRPFGEQHVVQPVVAVHQRLRPVVQVEDVRDLGNQALDESAVLRGQVGVEALDERRCEHRDDRGHHRGVLRRRPVQPRPRRMRRVLPGECMQLCQALQRLGGNLRCAPGDVVTLAARREVGEHHGVGVGLGHPPREIVIRHAGQRRELGVDGDLDLIAARDLTRGPTVRVRRRELRDHTRRPGAGGLIRQRDPDRVGHLAGADGGGREAADPRSG